MTEKKCIILVAGGKQFNSVRSNFDTATGEVHFSTVNSSVYFGFPGIVFGRRYDLEVKSKQYLFGSSSVTSFSDDFGVVLFGQRNANQFRQFLTIVNLETVLKTLTF